MTPIQQEKLEVLDGSRNRGAARRAAVRIDDLAALLALPERLKAQRVTAAPTADDFNALVDDMALLHQRLIAVATALQARILP